MKVIITNISNLFFGFFVCKLIGSVIRFYWGISVRQGEKKTGSLYLKGKAEVRVALQSVDGEKEYAVQCIRTNAGDWKKYTFELTPDKTDENARLAIYLEEKGRIHGNKTVLNKN